MNVIYKMAENPDLICEEMLKEITKIVMTHYVENGPEKLPDAAKDKEDPEKETEKEGKGDQEAAEIVYQQPEPSQSQGNYLKIVICGLL